MSGPQVRLRRAPTTHDADAARPQFPALSGSGLRRCVLGVGCHHSGGAARAALHADGLRRWHPELCLARLRTGQGSRPMIALYIIIGVVVLLVIATIVSYNRFVRQRNLVQESWRQIDVELNRRHDLIPNLVETVRGYAAHERGVFEAVTQARAAAQQTMQAANTGPAAQAQAEGVLGQALGRLMAVVENYPQLQANQQFIALQQQLTETEDRIAAGRRFYNANVRALNTRVEAFPSSIIASMFNFEKAEYFEVHDEATRQPVQVDFSSITGAPSVGTTPGGAAPSTPPAPPTGPQGGAST